MSPVTWTFGQNTKVLALRRDTSLCSVVLQESCQVAQCLLSVHVPRVFVVLLVICTCVSTFFSFLDDSCWWPRLGTTSLKSLEQQCTVTVKKLAGEVEPRCQTVTLLDSVIISILPHTMPPKWAHNQCSRHTLTKCTPTKCARLWVLHEECDLSFNEISLFKHTTLHPRTLERNYHLMKEHGEDCDWDGRKGISGRKKGIHSKNMLFMFTSHSM
jgi:hypothetical protein